MFLAKFANLAEYLDKQLQKSFSSVVVTQTSVLSENNLTLDVSLSITSEERNFGEVFKVSSRVGADDYSYSVLGVSKGNVTFGDLNLDLMRTVLGELLNGGN